MTSVESLSGRTVLVTGAAGFIGSRIVEMALRVGAQVTALVRPDTNLDRLRPSLSTVSADVRDFDRLCGAVSAARPELVIHAAAYADGRQDPTLSPAMMEVNALGTTHVLEAARLAGARRVVILGSVSEYGDAPDPLREDGPRLPLDPYAASKVAATEMALTYHRSFGVTTTVVRPFVVYGPREPRQRLFPSLFAAALGEGGDVACTPGQQVRDFVYVDDVAAGSLRALTSAQAGGEVINLGTGIGTSVRDAVRLAVEISGGRVRPQFGALPYRPGEPKRMVASTDKCARLLGWTPSFSLAEGLTAYWRLLAEART